MRWLLCRMVQIVLIFCVIVQIVTVISMMEMLTDRPENGSQKTLGDSWVLQSDTLPEKEGLRPSIGNGYIGSIVYHQNIHVSGIYNGIANASQHNDTSTHCKIPNQLAFRLGFTTATVVQQRLFRLDLFKGVFTEEITTAEWQITIRQYAYQIRKTLLVVEVIGVAKGWIAADLNVTVESLALNETQIRDMQILERKTKENFELRKYMPIQQEDARVAAPTLTVAWTKIPAQLIFSRGNNENSWTFIMASVVNSGENTAYMDLQNGLDDAKSGELFSTHMHAWRSMWNDGGRMDILKNDDLAQTVHAAHYYMLSSAPTSPYMVHDWPNFGLSPASLAHSDNETEHYWGHIFWDQETWMLPALVPFQPETVKRILSDSRLLRLEKAQEKAKKMGFDGAMFPWEVGYSGVETTNWQAAALREIHITGDIAQFARHYFYWTNDKDFLSNGGYNLFYQVAKFWSSRVVWLPARNAYGILDLMGPDEDHDHVNNSAYTNAIAASCLLLPSEFYKLAKRGTHQSSPPDPKWLNIAQNMYIPFEEHLQFHPQHDGYDTSAKIKQADVVLLGYPLSFQMKDTVRHNDLSIYEANTRSTGPCMTWAMHSIGWLDLSKEDKAYNSFKKNFDNIRGPFKVWTENAAGDGAMNFITGAGGFLQNLLNGYLGLRVHSDRLDFNPKTIPNTGGYVVSNVKYHGCQFTFSVTNQGTVNLHVSMASEQTRLILYRYRTKTSARITPPNTVLSLEKYAIIIHAKTVAAVSTNPVT